jgi:hypothetical protein
MKISGKARTLVPMVAFLLICGDVFLTYAMFRMFEDGSFSGYREYNPVINAIIARLAWRLP